jgi:general secretion pathway protein G
MRRKRGFTLLELLVVLAIIAILGAYVGVQVAQFPAQARITAAKAQLKTFHQALGLYRQRHSAVPTAAQGLRALVACPTFPPVPENYPAEGYLDSRRLPADPWGRDYVYVVPGPEGLPYDIISYGADGEPGGDGDAADLVLSQL